MGFRRIYPPIVSAFFTFDLLKNAILFLLFKMKYPNFLFFKVCFTLLFYLCTQFKDVIV